MSYFEMNGMFDGIKAMTHAAAAAAPRSESLPRPPGRLPSWALPAAAIGSVALLVFLLRSPRRRNPSRAKGRVRLTQWERWRLQGGGDAVAPRAPRRGRRTAGRAARSMYAILAKPHPKPRRRRRWRRR